MTILCYILGGFLGGLWGAIVSEYFLAWYWKPTPTDGMGPFDIDRTRKPTWSEADRSPRNAPNGKDVGVGL